MNTSGGPDTIYLIRHGEKLGDPNNDKDGGPNLSVRGSARAAALPSLFAPAPTADPATMQACALTLTGYKFTGAYSNVTLEAPLQPLFKRPGFLFATAPTESHRPLETITPLAAALDLTPNSQFEDMQVDCVANEVKGQPRYAGTTVLVCWHHGQLPALAHAIGVPAPPKWDAVVFDRVWRIDYSRDPQTLIDLPQSLLFGDDAK